MRLESFDLQAAIVESDVSLSVQKGCYARVVLKGGPTLSGYAGADPEVPALLRLDTLVAEEDGGLADVSLRLLPEEIEEVEVLALPPQFTPAIGVAVTMPMCFWPRAED